MVSFFSRANSYHGELVFPPMGTTGKNIVREKGLVLYRKGVIDWVPWLTRHRSGRNLESRRLLRHNHLLYPWHLAISHIWEGEQSQQDRHHGT